MANADIRQLEMDGSVFYPQTDIHGLVNNGEYAIDNNLVTGSDNLLENGIITENFIKRPTEQTDNLYDTYDLYKNHSGTSYSDGVVSTQITNILGFIELPFESGSYTVSYVARCDGDVTTENIGLYTRIHYTDDTTQDFSTSYLYNNQNTFVQLYATSNSSKTISKIEFRCSRGSLNNAQFKEFQIRKASSVLPFISSVSSVDYNGRNTVNAKIDYYICNSGRNSVVKVVDAPNYKLSVGGSIKIKMTYCHLFADSTEVSLNINNTGNIPLYYNGNPVRCLENASGICLNTWDDNEIIEVYYDGTVYQAHKVLDGYNYFNISKALMMAFLFNDYSNAFVTTSYSSFDNNTNVGLTLNHNVNERRKSSIIPFISGTLTVKGKVDFSIARVIKELISYNDTSVIYKIDTQTSESSITKIYDEDNDLTVIKIKTDKGYVFSLKNADDGDADVDGEFVSFVPDLDYYTNTLVNGLFSNSGIVKNSFINGGWSIDNDVITLRRQYRNRFCTIFPIDSGIFKFSGHIKMVMTPKSISEVVNFTENDIVYKIGHITPASTIEYDDTENITTITVKSVSSFVLSLGYVDNRIITEIPLISYTPIEISDAYEIPLHFKTPWKDDIHKYMGQPTMVVAENGTIIVSGYWGEDKFYDKLFTSHSDDDGETWTTNWNSGKPTMAWDREMHRLVSVWGDSAYISSDYGMTWTECAQNLSYVSPEMQQRCLARKQAEQAAYEADPTIQRYAYIVYDRIVPNSGCQLTNGVICMPRSIIVKKVPAKKDENNNWILDTDGYPKYFSEMDTFNDIRIPDSVVYVKYSRDNGNTWINSPTTPLDLKCGDENFVLEAKDNQVCINQRGGTESVWEESVGIRLMWFQHTPGGNDKETFFIDSWDADYGTRITNTIEESIVNAGGDKVVYDINNGSSINSIKFWLFCNIHNPGRFERHSLMLRLSADCHNWLDLKTITREDRILSGYNDIASDDSHIYIVFEGDRNVSGDSIMFARIDTQLLKDILITYDTANKYFLNESL